jgi:putative multiple sugar transport system ATP-binding protein
MRNIIKDFPGVRALDRVGFSVKNNHIHALVGENGAGKSTLMGVLSGVYPYGSYDGEILFNDVLCKFHSIRDSERKGIAIIHQELALSQNLSIAENIFLGNEIVSNQLIDWAETHRRAREVLEQVGLDVDTTTLVKNIGVGKQQLVEIAKAIVKKVKLLILDEPTAALNDEEANLLLELLLKFKSEGLTSIIISHKLHEIMKVADEITILRDGQTIETLDKAVDEITEDRIIVGMVGRSLKNRFPSREPKIGENLFEVSDWNVFDPGNQERKVIKDVSFNVHSGEIVGIAGLMGAGRTELAKSIFGRAYGTKISGTIRKNGKNLTIHSIKDAIKNGIIYLTEDRKEEGLILMHDIRFNLTLGNLSRISNGMMVDEDAEVVECEKLRELFKIKISSLHQKVRTLSGGNQQKVVFSKWIFAGPEILLLDEPTRGIDVGAKYEIYTTINKLADEGRYIVMISSEMEELIGLCDRIYVMKEGCMVGEFSRAEVSQEKIMKSILKNS